MFLYKGNHYVIIPDIERTSQTHDLLLLTAYIL